MSSSFNIFFFVFFGFYGKKTTVGSLDIFEKSKSLERLSSKMVALIEKNKQTLKGVVSFLLALIFLLSSFSLSFGDDRGAPEDDDGDRKKLIEEIENSEYSTTEDAIEESLKAGVIDRDDGIPYLFYRLLMQRYMYDVDEEVAKDHAKRSKESFDEKAVVDGPDGGRVVCDHDNDGHLLYHNCNIPSFLTGVMQVIYYGTLSGQPVVGAGKTSAKAAGGFGVPLGVENVPIEGESRYKEYTALEVFGYNLPLTAYVGEWDNIVVITKARLMSNFGLWDKILITGHTIFKGIKKATKSLVQLFTGFKQDTSKYNAGFMTGVIGGTIESMIDTSDANVAYTHAWSRVTFADNVYNARYLSSKDVAERQAEEMIKYMLENINDEMLDHPVFGQWLGIYYDDLRPWSAGSSNENDVRFVFTSPPNANEMTQQELEAEMQKQFHQWATDPDVVEFFDHKVRDTKNIHAWDLIDPSDYHTLFPFIAQYHEDWDDGIKSDAAESSGPMMEITDKLANKFLAKDLHYQPQREISRWVCVDDTKEVTHDDIMEADYVFAQKKTVDEEAEYQDPNGKGCLPIRPPIEAGFFGTGYQVKDPNYEITDTRWLAHNNALGAGLTKGVSSLVYGTPFWSKISSLFAKITNTLLSLSFSNIFEMLGLTKIVESTVLALRDSVFWPLAYLAIGLLAFWLFVSAMRKRSIKMFFVGIGLAMVVFVFSIYMLDRPHHIMALIDEIPSKIERAAMQVIDLPDNKQDICGSTKGSEKGVRQIQCMVWDVCVFSPYIYQQWGTVYDNLDSSKFNNSNKDLVGDGGIMKNWGFYQLSLLKTGSITDHDPKAPEGVTDRNIYRLVDLQAGPNHGEKSDAKYFSTWTGQSREKSVPILSAILSFVMMIVIGSMAIFKVEVSIFLGLYLMFFPFAMMVSLLPGGWERFKKYSLNVVSYIIKRTVIVLLIMITFIFLFAVQSVVGQDNYTLVVFMSIIFLLVIHVYRGEITAWFELVPQRTENLAQSIKNMTPRPIKQAARRSSNRFKATVGGFGAGLALGIKNVPGHMMRGETINGNPIRVRDYVRSGVASQRKGAAVKSGRAEQKEGWWLPSDWKKANATADQYYQAAVYNPENEKDPDVIAKRQYEQVNKKSDKAAVGVLMSNIENESYPGGISPEHMREAYVLTFIDPPSYEVLTDPKVIQHMEEISELVARKSKILKKLQDDLEKKLDDKDRLTQKERWALYSELYDIDHEMEILQREVREVQKIKGKDPSTPIIIDSKVEKAMREAEISTYDKIYELKMMEDQINRDIMDLRRADKDTDPDKYEMAMRLGIHDSWAKEGEQRPLPYLNRADSMFDVSKSTFAIYEKLASIQDDDEAAELYALFIASKNQERENLRAKENYNLEFLNSVNEDFKRLTDREKVNYEKRKDQRKKLSQRINEMFGNVPKQPKQLIDELDLSSKSPIDRLGEEEFIQGKLDISGLKDYRRIAKMSIQDKIGTSALDDIVAKDPRMQKRKQVAKAIAELNREHSKREKERPIRTRPSERHKNQREGDPPIRVYNRL